MRVPSRKDDVIMVSRTQPVYELRARRHGPGDTEIEVWQLPSLATPQISVPMRLASAPLNNTIATEPDTTIHR